VSNSDSHNSGDESASSAESPAQPDPGSAGAAPDESRTPEEAQIAGEQDAEQARKEDPLNRFLVTWLNAEGEAEQGPLYVLWELIESYKVDIFDVSLNRITADFMGFLQRAESLEIELASSFAVMASRLLYYKSRALLPDPGFEDADEEPRLPPELVQQLLEYRKFQLAAERLGRLEDAAQGMLARETGLAPISDGEQNEWLEVSLVDLARAYSKVLRRLEEVSEESEEVGYEIKLEEFSVEDKIQYLRGLLQESQSFAFQELFEKLEEMNRGEIIATFLALLELTRMGEIIIRQKANFEEIRIFKRSVVVS